MDTVNLTHHGQTAHSLFHPTTASTSNLVYFLHQSVMQSAPRRQSVECNILIEGNGHEIISLQLRHKSLSDLTLNRSWRYIE